MIAPQLKLTETDQKHKSSLYKLIKSVRDHLKSAGHSQISTILPKLVLGFILNNLLRLFGFITVIQSLQCSDSIL